MQISTFSKIYREVLFKNCELGFTVQKFADTEFLLAKQNCACFILYG